MFIKEILTRHMNALCFLIGSLESFPLKPQDAGNQITFFLGPMTMIKPIVRKIKPTNVNWVRKTGP
jgi:hypothetical protein